MARSLPVIYETIAARARAVEAAYGDWPCRVGCDHCCRHLHRVPEATADEWRRFERGVRALPPARRDAVLARIERLAGEPGHVVCPALDDDAGACLVYADRPAACRSYGYYRGRAHDAWCHRVEDFVAEQTPGQPVPFGNQDSLEAALRRTGGRLIPMTEWFRAPRT